MATFIVFTRESTQNQNELNIYLGKVGETMEGHPVRSPQWWRSLLVLSPRTSPGRILPWMAE
jgi:hypothetical protein